jgi:hypothetical protein
MIMTQEDKELLLKDLSARLPYKVKASYYGAEEEREIWDEIEGISSDGYVDIGQYGLPIESVKPYLFPLSSMNEEQLFEVQEILGKNEIKIEDGFLRIVDSDRNTISYLEIHALLNWFYKNHFDICGLIKKGLAIEVNKSNNPYKK